MNNFLKRLVWLPMAFLLVACESVDQPVPATESLVEIKKSPNDTRDYRYLVLENQLRVVLISDPKADKAAASMSIFRGSYDDPVDRAGLAHFLEHMLFIGTEKYPEPDGYFGYVRAHGGSSNAYTASDHTNYFFDIQPEAFPEGLDRFAQFFIAPLFQAEYAEREKNAVQSEYQLQLKEDGWRASSVRRMAMSPDHPASRFNIGSLDTLSGDVQEALVKFFREEYSANQMALVVLSNESLDDMQPWISGIFSAIENRDLEPAVVSTPLFTPGSLPATLAHDNVKNEYRVDYRFPMPATLSLYRDKPVQYLSNLIGHEGEGSLHALLTRKGWINSLAAGDGDVDTNTSLMSVVIDLTPAGAEHVAEINSYLFAYLDMLRSEPIMQWLYQEQATVAELGFRFKEKSSAMGAVQSLSPAIAYYPPEDLLVAPYLMESFDPALISKFLDELTPDNVLVSVSAPGYQGDATEPWFGVSYTLTNEPLVLADIDAAEVAELFLPAKNPFLPESLDLVEADSLKPVAVIDSPELEVYLDTDVEFGVPRAVLHISLRNAGGLMSLDDVARAQLYAALVEDELTTLAYPALLAGVSYNVAAPPRGFRISIGGYADKQLVLLTEVLDRLVALEIDPARFEVLKADFLKDLDNAKRGKPFQQTYGRLQDEFISSSWTPDELTEALIPLTAAEIESWRDLVLSEVSVQALVHGNVTEQRVDELMALLESRLSISEVKIAEPTVVQLSGAGSLQLDIDHNDAAMVLYVQDASDSFDERAKSALLTHLIAPGYFSQLRTEQQLGYAVFAVNTRLRGRGGISFVIQSPVAGPDVLRNQTLQFMLDEEQRFAEMSDDEFTANKGGLIAKLTQRDKNLSQRGARYWSDLDLGITSFDSNMQLAGRVAALNREDMLAFLNQVNQQLGNQYFMIYSSGQFTN